LVQAAGRSAAVGQSARRLVERLSPQSVPVAVGDHFDIDTKEQLLTWQLRDSPAVRAVLGALEKRGVNTGPSTPTRPVPSERPYVIAIDGPGGAGKSTLASALALRLPGTVIDGDDFYSARLPLLSDAEREAMSDQDASESIIDWRRLRSEALMPLLARQTARYSPYDWDADDGSLTPEKEFPAADVIIIDGVHSARPELADLVDLSVFVDVAPQVRYQRLGERHDVPEWSRFWDRAERHYFTTLRPPECFQLRIAPGELDNR
jgi:uridine kinase